MKKGDIVARISHNFDIIFIIFDIVDDVAILQGLYVRLVADSPIYDLQVVDNNDIKKIENEYQIYQRNIINNYKTKIGHITGKILHLDSDSNYLDKCMSLYKLI